MFIELGPIHQDGTVANRSGASLRQEGPATPVPGPVGQRIPSQLRHGGDGQPPWPQKEPSQRSNRWHQRPTVPGP